MPKAKLSDVGLQSLKAPPQGHLDYWDAALPTFGVRVAYSGTKTFILKLDNSRRALGRYPILSLANARGEAKRMLAERTLGKIRPQSITFPQARDLFIEEKARGRKPRTAAEYKRLLARLPFKGQLSHITPDEFRRRLSKFASPSERDHLLVASKVFFNWCIKRRYLEHNPAFGLSTGPVRRRARVLSDGELRLIWLACSLEPVPREDTALVSSETGFVNLPRAYATIVKLLILTGQRRGEIAALHSSYYSHNQQTICLPSELTKNGREHTFPLSNLCESVLRPLLNTDANTPQTSGLLFPARGHSSTPFSGWSKSKKVLNELSGLTNWTLQDLRRTFRTNLGKLGVAPYIAERLVNHISAQTDMEQVYDQYKYLPEMREAMEKWEARLQQIIAPEPAGMAS